MIGITWCKDLQEIGYQWKKINKEGEHFGKQNACMRVLFFKKPTFFANPKKPHFRTYPPNTLGNFWFSLHT
jgi:hypothetical protein